jgi:signal transduction histidine kinase
MRAMDDATASDPGMVDVDAFDTAQRRMLAHAGLIESLAAAVETPMLACRALARLQDDVEAIAIYLKVPDEALVLVSHAGFAGAPPSYSGSAAELCGVALAELAELAGARRLLSMGAVRAPWLPHRAVTLTAIPFDQDAGREGGLVLFALRTTRHDVSLAALLHLSAATLARAMRQNPSPATGALSPVAAPTRVLLIDDEALLVLHVQRILERAGFAFFSACGARDGLALATSIRPDVILVDKMMPDIDGVALLRMMRSDPVLSTTPVIMLSGQADESARVTALTDGADDFVAKPFSSRDLVARIQASVRLVRMRRNAIWREGELVRLRQSQQELQTLLDTVQKVRADERKMLARELHDQLGQILTAVKIDMRLLEKAAAAAAADADAGHDAAENSPLPDDSGASSIDMAIAAVQNISALLRPPALEEGGLPGALRWQSADLQRRTRITCTLAYVQAGYIEPPEFVAGELLRMCQEALTNVLRHAGATRIVIQLARRGACLILRICDDGAGIAREALDAPGSLGLQGMRERAQSIGATVRVRGRLGRGTMVTIRRRLAYPG